MCRSDVLLLDEPTNHLDLDAVIWLQDWLCKYPGTLLLISHDRDFLDTITDHIVHIEQSRAEIYTGNYSAFERMRAENCPSNNPLLKNNSAKLPISRALSPVSRRRPPRPDRRRAG